MKWGLIPSWTFKSSSKTNKSQKTTTTPPSTSYTTTLKTINCRDDSLSSSTGIWSSIKHRHRCIIPAQGFFEWLNVPGPFNSSKPEKVPHYVKRKDEKLMLFAGLYDCAHYTYTDDDDDETGEEEKQGEIWSYTIITTSSNEQLRFLHDRMPVILEPGSEEMKRWLDPELRVWGKELQSILKPFGGELEVYPVDKRVGKVGNDGEDLVVRKEVRREERDIGSWFGGGGGGGKGKMKGEKVEEKGKGLTKEEGMKDEAEVEVKTDTGKIKTESVDELIEETGQEQKELRGMKREASSELGDEEQPPAKKSMGTEGKSSPMKGSRSQQKLPPPTPSKAKGNPISATKNKGKASPVKQKNAPPPGMQKITKFFGNSA